MYLCGSSTRKLQEAETSPPSSAAQEVKENTGIMRWDVWVRGDLQERMEVNVSWMTFWRCPLFPLHPTPLSYRICHVLLSPLPLPLLSRQQPIGPSPSKYRWLQAGGSQWVSLKSFVNQSYGGPAWVTRKWSWGWGEKAERRGQQWWENRKPQNRTKRSEKGPLLPLEPGLAALPAWGSDLAFFPIILSGIWCLVIQLPHWRQWWFCAK